MNMHLLHEENMQERVQAAGSRYLVQVMLESMIVVTDVQLMCTIHACARQILPDGIWNRDSRWLQKKHTPGQLNTVKLTQTGEVDCPLHQGQTGEVDCPLHQGQTGEVGCPQHQGQT